MTSLKTPVVAMLALLLVPLASVAIPVASEGEPQAQAVLFARAKALYEMLNRSLALNISTELRNEIQNLLKANISALSVEELRVWVNNASRLLARVSEEVRVGGRAYAIGIVLERYLNGIKKALEERLKRLNITIPINLTRARDIRELNMMLKDVEKIVETSKLQKFANASVVVALKNAVKSVEEAEKAQLHLALAEKALNKTIERLVKLNVSEEALRVALEKVREAREVVANATQVAKQKAKSLAESLKESLENRTAETMTEIEELKQELQGLREVVVDEKARQQIDAIISKLEELRSKLANVSEDLPRWMPDLGEIKGWVKSIKERVNKTITPFIPTWIPSRNVDKAFNETITKAKKLLEEVKQMVAELNKTKTMVCIALYPPPPICKAILEARAAVEAASKLVARAEEGIATAERLYAEGKKLEALLYANRAYAELQVAKAWLEPLYNIIKRATETTTTPTTTPPQQAQPPIKVREAKLKKERCGPLTCTYTLTITIRNEGSKTTTIHSISIDIIREIQKSIGISLAPGEEKTINISIEIQRFITITTPLKATLITSEGTTTIQIQVETS
jgi:DNA repair exonuclease SbcCD ATPase subunit